MEIDSQITISIKPDAPKSHLQMGALEPGSTLKLKIIGLQGDRALIDFGNFRATADIKIPVTLGQELMVRVLEAGKLLKLGVINADHKNPLSAELSAQRLEAAPAENLNKAGHDLSRILNLLLPQHFIAEKETLQKIFGPGTLAILKGAIATLLSDIARQQGRALSQLESADPLQVFTYTLPLKEGDQTARLKVFYEKKQKSGSKKGFQISLLLSMDRLGDVRTDIFLVGNDLSITFYVTEPSAMIEIQENYQELDELLHDLFDRIQLKVKVSAKRVKDFDQPEVQMAGNRRVDLRI